MPATTQTSPTTTRPREDRYGRLQRGRRPRGGLTPAQVIEDQRTRIYEAAIELMADSGYRRTTIQSLRKLAGVSTERFYEIFPTHSERPPKEACFIGAFDYLVNRAVERIALAYREGSDSQSPICRAFEQFAIEVCDEPHAARFALVEPFGAGPGALERMDTGRQTFERMVSLSFGDPRGGAKLSSGIAKGIVGGVERITHLYLLDGRIHELKSTAEELSAWVSSYQPWTPPRPPRRARSQASPPRVTGKGDGLRIMRAAIVIAARDGYTALTPPGIAELADIRLDTFYRFYSGPNATENCFLTAFRLLGVQAVNAAVAAAQHEREWAPAVRTGIAALMDHLASNPHVARLAFIEVFKLGPSASERRTAVIEKFTDAFAKTVPNDAHQPSQLILDAIAGGIWAMIHDYVVHDRIDRLHEIANDATYLLLAPVIGHQATVDVIERAASATEPAPSLAA